MLKAASLIMSVIAAAVIIAVRLKASKKPVTSRKLLLPPIFMSTGFLMFTVPFCRVPWYEALEAFGVGVLFSFLLIKTSKFSIKQGFIYLQRSKAFIVILVALLIIRTIMKLFLEGQVDVPQLSGLFFILAFGMIMPWRVAMYMTYRRIERQLNSPVSPTP